MLQSSDDSQSPALVRAALERVLFRAWLRRWSAVKHEHLWQDIVSEKLGFYSKRNDPKDVRWYLGKVQECACGALIFWPNGGLKAVDVVRVDLDQPLRETLA